MKSAQVRCPLQRSVQCLQPSSGQDTKSQSNVVQRPPIRAGELVRLPGMLGPLPPHPLLREAPLFERPSVVNRAPLVKTLCQSHKGRGKRNFFRTVDAALNPDRLSALQVRYQRTQLLNSRAQKNRRKTVRPPARRVSGLQRPLAGQPERRGHKGGGQCARLYLPALLQPPQVSPGDWRVPGSQQHGSGFGGGPQLCRAGHSPAAPTRLEVPPLPQLARQPGLDPPAVPRRGPDPHPWAVPDPQVQAAHSLHQRHVFQATHLRPGPELLPSRQPQTQIGPEVLVVAQPGVGGIGVQQAAQAGREQVVGGVLELQAAKACRKLITLTGQGQDAPSNKVGPASDGRTVSI